MSATLVGCRINDGPQMKNGTDWPHKNKNHRSCQTIANCTDQKEHQCFHKTALNQLTQAGEKYTTKCRDDITCRTLSKHNKNLLIKRSLLKQAVPCKIGSFISCPPTFRFIF